MTRAIQRARAEHPAEGEQTGGEQAAGEQSGTEHGTEGSGTERVAAGDTPVQRRVSVPDAIDSPSRPLESRIRQRAEAAYGMGFGHVRVHNEAVAQHSAADLDALAYTTGPHIVLGSDRVSDEVMFEEVDHVRQQALGPVPGRSNGKGEKVSDPHDPFEQSAGANGKKLARGEAPDLALPGAGAPGGAVQRSTDGGVSVQRMENPRGRRNSGEYEADESAPEQDSGRDADSSPERRELQDHIRRQLGEGADLGDVADRLNRLGEDAPRFRRVRRVRRDSDSDSPERPAGRPAQGGPAPEELLGQLPEDLEPQDLADLVEQTDRLAQDGPQFRRVRRMVPESDSDSPERPAGPPAREQGAGAQFEDPFPELPENDKLDPLRALLLNDMHENGLNKKLKVTFSVTANEAIGGGHAWMEVTGSDGVRVTFGFFPVERNGLTLLPTAGGVLCPDPIAKYGATNHESKNVTLREIVQGYHLIHSKSNDTYHFTAHNCTTFAAEVWKSITGKAVPTNFLTVAGAVHQAVANPRATNEGIASHQEQRLNDRKERMRPLAEGPMRGMIPGPGTAEEVADRLARERQSQTSSSDSGEVD
ncbi:DUF4157 domain-containing protein [Streptomyces sp. NPDC059009]|uniref:eCIS core domain-containing protein n=1 Tax=Streptomyces sp. NPDC059009 TaxID=3346694 RepID=UPI0036976FF7